MKSILLKVLLVLSPVLVALAYSFAWINIKGPAGQEALGIMVFFMFLFGVPFVLITGSIVSLLFNSHRNVDKISLFAFLVPAVMTWLYLIIPR